MTAKQQIKKILEDSNITVNEAIETLEELINEYQFALIGHGYERQ